MLPRYSKLQAQIQNTLEITPYAQKAMNIELTVDADALS